MIEKILIIILINLVFFAKTLCYKYSSDDLPVLQNPPNMRDKWERFLFWLDGRRRTNPQADHFLTTIIHAAVCVFIYLGFGRNDISFLAAILFSFNPTNNQGSVWISGRAYALAALGMTGALAFPGLAMTFLLLATYTNAGFIAPLAFIGGHLALLAITPVAWWINWKRFTGNVQNKMKLEMLDEDKAIKPQKLVLALKTFGFYTLLSIIPFQNAFYHSFLQSSSGAGRFKAYSMKDRFFWIGAVMAAGILAYWVIVPWNTISFALLFYCVTIAPFSNFMRMSQEIAERYCYLPNCALMVVLASLIIQWPIVASAFIAMYAVRMWFLMDMYQDDYYLMEHACLQDPCSWFVWHVRGIKRWDTASYQEAVIIWTMARRISPKEFKINMNLATVLASNNNMEEAKYYLQVAKDNIPPGQEEASKKILDDWEKGNLTIIL